MSPRSRSLATLSKWSGRTPRKGERQILASAVTPRRKLTGSSQSEAEIRRQLMTEDSWPSPDVRERQLFGVSMRTAGFRQGIRKFKNPQSTRSRQSQRQT
jgi:hypothetical protein